MKKLLLLASAVLLAGFWFGQASAVPDPRDSVILDSKTIAPGAAAGATSDTGTYLRVRVWITNKDTLSNVTLPVAIRSLSGGAFFTGAWPRNFNGNVSKLTGTVGSTTVFNGRMNGITPDSATYAGFYDPSDPATWEPPNSSRLALWDLKYDTVQAPLGMVEIDSIKILANNVSFVDVATPIPNAVQVNFVKSTITVDITGDVQDIDNGQIPKDYSLAQNYPNPFNANTQINFALPKAGNARLDIYNVLGQKVSTLFNEYMNAGSKTVNWDGRDDGGVTVPSGVYFYQLVSQDFRQTKKMLLIK